MGSINVRLIPERIKTLLALPPLHARRLGWRVKSRSGGDPLSQRIDGPQAISNGAACLCKSPASLNGKERRVRYQSVFSAGRRASCVFAAATLMYVRALGFAIPIAVIFSWDASPVREAKEASLNLASDETALKREHRCTGCSDGNRAVACFVSSRFFSSFFV